MTAAVAEVSTQDTMRNGAELLRVAVDMQQ